jgi:UTP--glucose-1-phosphate uridylyltransferase
LLNPLIAGLVKKYPRTFTVVTNSFAAGALLATAFFLLLFEASHLISTRDGKTESEVAAAWGCMILFGFITSPLIDITGYALLELFQKMRNSKGSNEVTEISDASKEVRTINVMSEGGETSGKKICVDVGAFENEEEEALHTRSRQRRIVGGIIIGDFMHNFCDGIFIGSAFYVCGPSMGWVVTSTAVYHEIAQEISDFCVLTDPTQGNLRAWVALLLNFISGTCVILGAILVLALDMTDFDVGMILAYGGGVYMHIAATECMSRVYSVTNNLTLRFIWLVSFVVGATAIGLVLLDHTHCSAADAGSDDGHGHRHR